MIPRECKRLAEVDFPIAAVSKHAVREKNIRHGHPSTLHLWWARRPLASCRAMLLALLLPDPCDPRCPEDFRIKAREILRPIPGRVGNSDEELRAGLLRFIGDFADWNHSASLTFLEAGRGLVKAAHPEETPFVVDPFAGGGSIPLEALRIGCDAFASDLNPIACLILKTMLEDIQRSGPAFADAVRRVAAEIKTAAGKELARYYPRDPDGARPIAYLWARTVQCEESDCGAEIPLVRSFWLSKKSGSQRALRYRVERPRHALPRLVFEIFVPKSDDEVPRGTVSRAKAVCPCCSTPALPKTLSPDRVRSQLSEQRGGADVVFDAAGRPVSGASLLAVVTIHPDTQGRQYRLPTDRDYAAVHQSATTLGTILSREGQSESGAIPDETIPLMSGTFNVPLYGMTQRGDLFTARQKLALHVFGNHLRGDEMPVAVRECLGLAYSRWTDIFNALCQWESSKTQVRHLFTRQALPMLWDFAENCVGSDQAGDFWITLSTIVEVIEALSCVRQGGQIQQADAKRSSLPSETANVWFTDPPYYFAVPYADLSDFFYVWAKRVLPGHPLMQSLEPNNPLTPKKEELCEMAHWDPVRYPHKNKEFFENGMAEAFAEGNRVLRDDGIGCVVFAHKTTEGWEALLSGMTKGGWVITGSWPIATEATTRLRARDSAALATSVHLVCRPRTEDMTGDWADVLRELPDRVGEWMTRLEGEGVRGADLVFACIGPALEIFSRYSRVETPDGCEVPLADYLQKVWEVVGRAALHQVLGTAEAQARNGGAGALEEDARLTALFLWTLLSTAGNGADAGAAGDAGEEPDDVDEEEDGGGRKAVKGYTLIYDLVHRFALPLGIHLDAWEGRIIETKKGIVRLLPVEQRAQQLFGEEGAAGLADRIERAPTSARQLELFPASREAVEPQPRGRRQRFATAAAQSAVTQATTLDRVHAAMLLQASGRTNGLRALLAAEQERGPDFLRLGNALTALYPQGSEEKRLLDAMLLATPR
jgi:putative DNA methylase